MGEYTEVWSECNDCGEEVEKIFWDFHVCRKYMLANKADEQFEDGR